MLQVEVPYCGEYSSDSTTLNKSRTKADCTKDCTTLGNGRHVGLYKHLNKIPNTVVIDLKCLLGWTILTVCALWT